MSVKNTCLSVTCAAMLPFTAFAAEPDYSFYGSLRVMVDEADHENGDNFKDALSRVGVTGSHDLGNGLSAFGKYELKLDLAEGTIGSDTGTDARLAHVGLAGDFGSVKFGRVWSTFYNAIGWAPDQLLIISAPVYYTLDPDFRIGKSAMYNSPNINGLQLSALYSNDKELGQFSASYQATDSLKLAAGFIDDDNDSVGLAAYYSGDGFYVNGMYMDKDNTGKGVDIIGGLTSGKSAYTLGVSSYEGETGSNDFDAVILGYQYSLHEKVKLWVEARSWDGVLYGTADSNDIKLGIKYDF